MTSPVWRPGPPQVAGPVEIPEPVEEGGGDEQPKDE